MTDRTAELAGFRDIADLLRQALMQADALNDHALGALIDIARKRTFDRIADIGRIP